MVIFKPFQKQEEFIKAVFSGVYRYLFYGGGSGGGKSYVCMAILILLCKFFKGSKWHVIRKDTTRLEKTSIPTFKKVCPSRFLLKFVDNVAYFSNGSQIHFVPENYDRDKELTWMDGLETNGFLLEEVQEINKKTFNKAKLRAGRHIISPMPPIYVLCTGNPSQNWSKDTFVKEPLNKDKDLDMSQWSDGELKAPYFFKQALMSDNSEIPEGYKKGMENLDSITYRKFVLGDWDVIDVDKPFAYAFDPKKHIGKLHRPSKSLPLYLSFDFNVDPITCLVGQHTAKYIKFHKEYRLRNSNIYALCAEIKKDWPGYYFYVTGDASGNNRSAMVQGNLTYYKIIQAELKLGPNQMQVPTSNPGLKNNRVLVNSLLEKFPSIIFDAEGCPYTIKDMQYCEVDHKGDIDKTKDKHLTHLLDCFTGETMIKTSKGDKQIKDIKIGEKVLTRFGYKKVIDSWKSEAFVYEFELTDGTKITCTKDHKFFSPNYGWCEILRIFEENKKVWKLSITEEDIQTAEENISPHQKTRILNTEGCTNKNGTMPTEKYQKDTTYTIRTKIISIIIWIIWSVLKVKNIVLCTCKKGLAKTRNYFRSLQQQEGNMLRNGTDQKRGLSGINNMPRILNLEKGHTEKETATNAILNSRQGLLRHVSAQINARQNIEEIKDLMTSKYHVKHAQGHSREINTNTVTSTAKYAEVGVKCYKLIGKRTVYDITVEESPEFFANNILVHNCSRYYLHRWFFTWLKDGLI